MFLPAEERCVTVAENDSDAGQAMNALRRLVRAVRTANRSVQRAVGISGAQLFVLRRLEERPRQALSDLAIGTLTDPSTVSEVVGRLVAAGYVARHVAAADARRAELELTSRGRALLRKAPETLQSVLVEGFSRLPAAKRRALAEGLQAWVGASYLADLPPTMMFEPTEPPSTRRRLPPIKKKRNSSEGA
jgi:MarR family transcriptional regulator, organic hydroperoxide resistance regulator